MATNFTIGLQASWELNESSGNFVDQKAALEFVPSGLTQGQTTIIPGGVACASGDGVNDDAKLTPPPNALKFGTASFAYEVWVKMDAELACMFFCQRTTTAIGANLEAINGNGIGVKNNIRLYIQDGSSNSALILSDATVNTATLYQLVAICDRTNNLLRLYINGSSAATAVTCAAVGSVSTTSDYNQIFAAAAGQYYAGKMQRFRVWTGVGAEFSASQVSELYNSGSGILYQDLSGGKRNGKALVLGVL